MDKERRTAGAPSDLTVRYFSAGIIIGESYKKKYKKKKKKKRGVVSGDIGMYPTINAWEILCLSNYGLCS